MAVLGVNFKLALAVSLVLVGGYFLAISYFHTGMDRDAAPFLTEFTLVDQEGQVFNLSRLHGHWSFLFFGYTFCPDICPTTLAFLHQVRTRLVEQAPDRLKDSQFIFVSVDGERDSPERLKGYVQFFDPNFMGATGNSEQVNQLTGQLGIIYLRKPGSDEQSYLIDHSSMIVLIGPRGEKAAIFPSPHEVETLVNEYLRLRSG